MQPAGSPWARRTTFSARPPSSSLFVSRPMGGVQQPREIMSAKGRCHRTAPVEEAKQAVIRAIAVHADETSWREAKKKAWL
jgi:hypothetical protein